MIITVGYLFNSKQLQDRVILAYAPWNAARVNAKCTMKVNGCNLLLIDFLLPLSRGAVCQVQSPAMHRRQQTVPVSRIRGHQLAGGAGWIRLHAGLESNRLLCFLIEANMVSPPPVQRLLSLWFHSGVERMCLFISVPCASNSYFPIKTHIMAFPNAPVPHWCTVCFDYVLSHSCLRVSVQTWHRRWKCIFQPESAKITANRSVSVLIITRSDFDSN